MDEYDFKGDNTPALEVKQETEVKHNSVTLNAKVSNDYGYPVSEKGFYYATTQEKLKEARFRKTVLSSLQGKGAYSVLLRHLQPNTTYYYLPFATNAEGTAIGRTVNHFTTAPAVAATVLTSEEVASTAYQLTFNATVPDDGGYPLTQYGFVYASHSSPTLSDSKESFTNDRLRDITEFSASVENPAAETTYYVRAYAVTRVGIAFGNVVKFRTSAAGVPKNVFINSPYNISKNSVTLSANVQQLGGADIIEAGFVYSDTTHSPTITTGSKVIALGRGKFSTFSQQINNLTPAKTYYVRAFVTNRAGTTYSEVGTLQTLPTVVPTGVSVTKIDSITRNSVQLTGSISSAEGGDIIERGFIYSLSGYTLDELTGNKIMVSGNNIGAFVTTITGLAKNTKYYLRAYAKNQAGIAYSSYIQSFTTKDTELPTLISNFQVTTMVKGVATITSDGGSTITRKGFVYSKYNSSPTLSDSHAIITSNNNTFSKTFTTADLAINSYYYMRAFATNEKGTAYSSVSRIHTTDISKPSVNTEAVTGISQNKATLNGKINSNGGGSISKYGFVYSRFTNSPSLNDGYTVELQSLNPTGIFSATISSLSAGVTYYVRAFAINELGITYGNVKSFRQPLSIGDEYEGGVVAYLFQSGDSGYVWGEQHGLIIPKKDDRPTNTYQWGCYSVYYTYNGIGEGKNNTTKIASACGSGNAAYYIKNQYRAGGKTDWFLPSIEELRKIYYNRNSLNISSSSSDDQYWSSTQYSSYGSNYAYYMHFYYGQSDDTYKSNYRKVLPVRQF
jgi:hypothetical protein